MGCRKPGARRRKTEDRRRRRDDGRETVWRRLRRDESGFAERLRRDKLGLIGFVFSSGGERDIGVSLCGIGCWVGFGVLEIGFVLRKKFYL